MTRGTTLKPAMRVIAAVVLVCWSAALVTCFHFCATRGCDRVVAAKSETSCQGKCAKTGHSQESKSPCGDSICFTKKPLAAEKDFSKSAQPSLMVAYLTAPLVVAFELPDGANQVFVRQLRPRDWAFTPEVSLGPAFRAHAPPAFI